MAHRLGDKVLSPSDTKETLLNAYFSRAHPTMAEAHVVFRCLLLRVLRLLHHGENKMNTVGSLQAVSVAHVHTTGQVHVFFSLTMRRKLLRPLSWWYESLCESSINAPALVATAVFMLFHLNTAQIAQ
jgi:hypothetical protein